MKLKNILKYIFVMMLLFIIAGCKEVHDHKYIDGICQCGSVDQNYIDLMTYKGESKQKIKNYFLCLSEEEYTTENWEYVKLITNEYTNQIDNQENKNEIELMIKKYKEQIKLISKKLYFSDISEAYPNITLRHLPIDSVIDSDVPLEITIEYGIPLEAFDGIYGLENIQGKIKIYYGILEETKNYDGETDYDFEEIEEYVIQEIPDLTVLTPLMKENIVIDNKVFSQEIGYVGILVEVNINSGFNPHVELNTIVILYERYKDKIILYGSMQEFMKGIMETNENK